MARSEPKLQPPGAGLPPLELFFTRRVVGPFIAPIVPWSKSVGDFEKESQTILELVKHATEEEMTQQVLIPRFFGIEDSSRNWSLAMTLQHLVIVSDGVVGVIQSLSQGQTMDVKVRIQDVKPDPSAGVEQIEKFQECSLRVHELLSSEGLDRESTTELSHPWFGGLTCHGWTWLLGVHQKIHRKQCERIIARL